MKKHDETQELEAKLQDSEQKSEAVEQATETAETPAQPAQSPTGKKPPISAGPRQALMRYMAVLFAAAFLLVLFSFLIQMRNNRLTISELTASSNNAMTNALALQSENEALRDENSSLQDELDAASDALADAEEAAAAREEALEQQLEEAEQAAADLQSQLDAASQTQVQLEEEKTALDQLAQFNESLLAAWLAVQQGDLEAAKTAYTEAYVHQTDWAETLVLSDAQKAMANLIADALAGTDYAPDVTIA